jgi:hypothetical protein
MIKWTMGKTWVNIKFFSGIFFQLSLTAAVFIIKTANKTEGVISAVRLQQNRGSKAISGQMDLVIYLENQSGGFWIYRQSQNYANIIDKLPVGDSATIYHDDRISSNGYYTAYQAETKNIIVYSRTEYEKKEKLGGRFVVLPGAVLLLAVIIYQIKKRYKTKAIMPAT